MSPIRVVLAQSHSDVLAGIIADALIDSLDFELVGDAVMALANIEDRLPEDHRGSDVLIVVGDISLPLVDAFVARYEGVVVSHIIIGSDAVRFDLNGLGLDQLLAALRVFAREGGPQRRALEYQLVPALPGVPEQACKLVPVDPIRRELVGACLAWIDAALLNYHRAWPETPGNVRGRARSWASVVSLLGARDEDEGDAELVRSGRAVEAAAGRLFQALDSGDARNEPLARCYRRLALTRTEMKLALLALAPEFGVRYQTVFGTLDDDLNRRSPSFALACAVVGQVSDVRGELATTRNLTRWRMLESCDQLPRAAEPLRLDVAVVAWLTGDDSSGWQARLELAAPLLNVRGPAAQRSSRSRRPAGAGRLRARHDAGYRRRRGGRGAVRRRRDPPAGRGPNAAGAVHRAGRPGRGALRPRAAPPANAPVRARHVRRRRDRRDVHRGLMRSRPVAHL